MKLTTSAFQDCFENEMKPEVVNWVKVGIASVRVLPSPRIGATPGPFVKQMNIHQMIY